MLMLYIRDGGEGIYEECSKNSAESWLLFEEQLDVNGLPLYTGSDFFTSCFEASTSIAWRLHCCTMGRNTVYWSQC